MALLLEACPKIADPKPHGLVQGSSVVQTRCGDDNHLWRDNACGALAAPRPESEPDRVKCGPPPVAVPMRCPVAVGLARVWTTPAEPLGFAPLRGGRGG